MCISQSENCVACAESGSMPPCQQTIVVYKCSMVSWLDHTCSNAECVYAIKVALAMRQNQQRSSSLCTMPRFRYNNNIRIAYLDCVYECICRGSSKKSYLYMSLGLNPWGTPHRVFAANRKNTCAFVWRHTFDVPTPIWPPTTTTMDGKPTLQFAACFNIFQVFIVGAFVPLAAIQCCFPVFIRPSCAILLVQYKFDNGSTCPPWRVGHLGCCILRVNPAHLATK